MGKISKEKKSEKPDELHSVLVNPIKRTLSSCSTDTTAHNSPSCGHISFLSYLSSYKKWYMYHIYSLLDNPLDSVETKENIKIILN